MTESPISTKQNIKPSQSTLDYSYVQYINLTIHKFRETVAHMDFQLQVQIDNCICGFSASCIANMQ